MTRLALVVIAVSLACAAGCATVHPWQRERLARPCMQTNTAPGSVVFEEHVRGIRVGDVHADAVGGGGCGCN